MKKILVLIIVLTFAISAATAFAAPGDAVLGRDANGSYDNYYYA